MSLGKNLNIGDQKKDAASEAKAEQPIKENKIEDNNDSPKAVELTKASKSVVPGEDKLHAETTAAVQSLEEQAAQRLSLPDAVDLASNEHMIIVFPVGDEEYAIAIDDVKEVVPMPPIAKIPQVSNYIMGVTNVRGNVLAVVDLAQKFLLAEDQASISPELGDFVLVVKSEEFSVAVNVKNVPNTMTVTDNEIDSPGNIINHTSLSMNHIKGIVKREKRMIVWIDIQEVIAQIALEDMN